MKRIGALGLNGLFTMETASIKVKLDSQLGDRAESQRVNLSQALGAINGYVIL